MFYSHHSFLIFAFSCFPVSCFLFLIGCCASSLVNLIFNLWFCFSCLSCFFVSLCCCVMCHFVLILVVFSFSFVVCYSPLCWFLHLSYFPICHHLLSRFLFISLCLYTLSHYTVLLFMVYTSVVWYLTTYVWNKSFIHSSQPPLRLYKACRFVRPSSKWLASGCQFATTSKCCSYFCRQRLKLGRLPRPQHAASFHVLQVLLTLRQWQKVNDPETHVQSLQHYNLLSRKSTQHTLTFSPVVQFMFLTNRGQGNHAFRACLSWCTCCRWAQ